MSILTPIANILEPSKPYWIIVSDEGHASIPHKHDTYQAAYDESVRLAKIKPEVNFSIFKYVGHTVAEKPKVSHHTYAEYPQSDYWNLYYKVGKWNTNDQF